MARWVVLLCCALSGCVSADRLRLEEALKVPPQPDSVARERYVLNCPDQVEVAYTGAASWQVEPGIGVDGRITLPQIGSVRVQGQTLQEARRNIARSLGCPPDQVRIQVKDHLSQQIFIHGQIAGEDRAIPFHGPETILDVLRRAGGLEPGAAVTEIGIVRGHVAEGRSPEVFDVDLRAIVLRNEPGANIRVEPFDQIYIGQSRRAEFVAGLPGMFRPAGELLLGIRRPGKPRPATAPLLETGRPGL